MNAKKISLIIILGVIVATGSFYGGMKYGQSNASQNPNFRNLSSEQRQQMAQQFGASASGGMRNSRNGQEGNNFTNGEIISKDDKSITIKMRDGGSKIVFLSQNTEISKFASGSLNDLEIGKSVSVNGISNQDGSITAQSIQLRPNAPTPTPSPNQ